MTKPLHLFGPKPLSFTDASFSAAAYTTAPRPSRQPIDSEEEKKEEEFDTHYFTTCRETSIKDQVVAYYANGEPYLIALEGFFETNVGWVSLQTAED